MINKEKFLRLKLKDFQHIFEQTEGIYEHPPDRGGPREKAVRDYLKYHLPKKYGVSTGKILNPSGMLSRQIDVIIYDSLNCPIIYSEAVGEEYQIIPADSTIGAIEVKSIVNKEIMRNIMINMESIKKVVGDKNKIIAGFFGYSTPVFKTEDEVDSYLYRMEKLFQSNSIIKFIKIGCILPNTKVTVFGKVMKKPPCFLFRRGDIELDSTITKGKERKLYNIPIFMESDPEVLLSMFMLILVNNLNKWKPRKYSMLHYAIQFGERI